jgi:hypothetical protein
MILQRITITNGVDIYIMSMDADIIPIAKIIPDKYLIIPDEHKQRMIEKIDVDINPAQTINAMLVLSEQAISV